MHSTIYNQKHIVHEISTKWAHHYIYSKLLCLDQYMYLKQYLR